MGALLKAGLSAPVKGLFGGGANSKAGPGQPVEQLLPALDGGARALASLHRNNTASAARTRAAVCGKGATFMTLGDPR